MPAHDPATPTQPHDQQAWYRTLFNQNPSAIVLSDLGTGAIFAANPEACRVLGYTEAHLRTLKLMALFDVTDPRWAVTVELCNRTGAFRGELTARRCDGTCLPVEVTASICTGDEGRPAAAYFFQDVSLRVRSEAASRESETKFAMLFAASPVSLHLARIDDGLIIDVNEAAAALFGFDRLEMIGHTGVELGIVTPEVRAAVLASAQGNRVRDQEVTLTCRSGETRNCLLSADILEMAQEQCLLISIIDVTARKQAERERAFMAAIVECAHDAIIGRDLNGLIVSWNAAAAEMFGWSIEDAIGMHITQGFPANRLQEFTSDSDDLLRHGFRRNSETQRQTKDGRIIDVAVSSSVVRDEKGEVLGIAAIARDITQQRRYEQVLADTNAELEQRVAARTEELATALAELKEAARLKDEFMATVSHELRTPLMGILSMADVLDDQLRSTLNQRQLRYIQNVRSSGQRLLQIVNSILNYTALASGRAMVTLERCHLGELGAIVVQAIRSRAEAKNLTLTLSVKPADLTVTTDSAGLKQILQHLLDNAIKFTPGGGAIGLEIERTPAAQFVQLIVWDTGIGITPQQQGNIFQPFVQADASLARQYDGLGLGLAYVQRMVDLLGGTIAVESTLGAGSRFRVSLPDG